MLFADLVILNGNIITVDDKNPRAEALAVKGEKFVAIGTTSQIRELIGANTRVIDIQGKTVIPGFNDAHCHPTEVARSLLQVDCSPSKVSTITDIVNVLAKRAKTTPSGKWLQGFGYDDTKLKENRHPTRWDLDKASTEHPIYITQVSGHIGVVNSHALEMAKVTKDASEPAGGRFDRAETGELTGVCREKAQDIFRSLIPPPTREEDKKAIHLLCQKYSRAGITSVGDAMVSPLDIRLYQDALEEKSLSIRVYMMPLYNNLPYLRELNLRTGFGNNRLQIGTMKMFLDGAIAGRTASLYEPYEGRPDDYGILVLPQEELDKRIFEAHEAGFQIGVHANGDRAINMLLDSYEKTLSKLPRVNHRHRIEHCTVVNPTILKRIKKLGLVVLPFSTYIWEHGEKMKEYGKRISMMFACRSFLDHGIPVAGSTDNPCGPVEPLLGLQSMVTRKSKDGETLGAEQKISIEEAIRIYTMGSAYASFEENIKGSIEIGKLADFVVLSDDPTKVPPESIRTINVEKTIVGGEIVYAFPD